MKVTGGSDKSGTPMRPDVHGGVTKYVLLANGIGIRNIGGGYRVRKLVRGNMVTEEIYQLNCVLVDGSLPVKEEASDTGKEVAKKEQHEYISYMLIGFAIFVPLAVFHDRLAL